MKFSGSYSCFYIVDELKTAYFLIVTLDLVTRHTLFYRTLFMEYYTRSGSKLLGILKDYLEFHITK